MRSRAGCFCFDSTRVANCARTPVGCKRGGSAGTRGGRIAAQYQRRRSRSRALARAARGGSGTMFRRRADQQIRRWCRRARSAAGRSSRVCPTPADWIRLNVPAVRVEMRRDLHPARAPPPVRTRRPRHRRGRLASRPARGCGCRSRRRPGAARVRARCAAASCAVPAGTRAELSSSACQRCRSQSRTQLRRSMTVRCWDRI